MNNKSLIFTHIEQFIFISEIAFWYKCKYLVRFFLWYWSSPVVWYAKLHASHVDVYTLLFKAWRACSSMFIVITWIINSFTYVCYACETDELSLVRFTSLLSAVNICDFCFTCKQNLIKCKYINLFYAINHKDRTHKFMQNPIFQNLIWVTMHK